MQRKGKKKNPGAEWIGNQSAHEKIEKDFQKAQAKIKAQMALVERFEDLVSMKITAEYCPKCRRFLECPYMRMMAKFSKHCSGPDPLELFFGKQLFNTFARGIVLTEDLKPVTETFSGN